MLYIFHAPVVVWLVVLCSSSSRCRVLVCSAFPSHACLFFYIGDSHLSKSKPGLILFVHHVVLQAFFIILCSKFSLQKFLTETPTKCVTV